ncbi:cytochrome c3 family protein [Sutterella massiliensis]|uniref:Cytochrome c3 family protein n=1 Tax=Sutterella massiliensis TaxID=1816689 RepID=A0ABS2DTI6_9BURK|nr:cytochrome c3 family protein [Sutterella massiliensis]MBM6704457.1 cytochrome c3 family protein [Sutterella massiliensis]
MLKNSISAALCASLLALFAAAPAGAADHFTADRHLGYGLKCETCHKSAGMPQPGARVSKDTCKSCHDPAELAKKTAKLDQNPHYNHLGDVNCTECHKGHQPSTLMCNDCHKFNLKTP